jgi:N-acetylmuramic acid 6-phosphate (MurNAc-6-P) etherase
LIQSKSSSLTISTSILGSPQLPVTTPLHAKLALDAITTWLGIRAGFVRQNRMINLTMCQREIA